MNKAEKQELIESILLAINELKDLAVEGEELHEDKIEMVWGVIEDHLTELAYGKA